jgi:hypothetical protein
MAKMGVFGKSKRMIIVIINACNCSASNFHKRNLNRQPDRIDWIKTRVNTCVICKDNCA